MSTIDPLARESDPAFARRRRLRWSAAMAGAAVVAGYGSSIFGDFPGSAVRFGAGEPVALVKTLVAMLAIVGAMLLCGVVVRLPEQPGVTGQQMFVLAVLLLAFDCGFFVGTFLPTSFRAYAHTDLSGTRDDLRITCGLLVVVAGALVALAARNERGTLSHEQLRKRGRRVSAVITEVHDTGITNNNAPWVRLTVRFTDAHGTARFVRRRISAVRFAGPSTGDHIPLWYDPADPGNEKKIVIGER